jgi:hypothetical protein
MSKINSAVAMATTAPFDLYNDDGGNSHEIFKQRCRITNNLQREMQSIVNGSQLGKDSGELEIREIVGNISHANVYLFTRSSFETHTPYQKVGFKIESLQDRSIEIQKKKDCVPRQWKEGGDLIEAFVVFKVLLLTQTKNQEIAMIKAETAHASGIRDSVFDAVNEGFHFGYDTGFQAGQTRYKDYHELKSNKWIYSFVDKSCDNAIYVSAECLLANPNLKRRKLG